MVAIRTPGGHRRYRKDRLDTFLGIADDDPPLFTTSHSDTGIPYFYTRVSSSRQQSDGNLDRQAARLETYTKRHFDRRVPYHLIQEYGSGLNPLRPDCAE